jgi:hypothetical protein
MTLHALGSTLRDSRGQSLIEILIAVVLGTVLILVAVTVISPALKSQGDTLKVQTASALGRELLDNIRVFAEADWHNLTNLAPGASNRYYLNTSSSPFTAVSGVETVTVATSTYERYFYYEGVTRDGGGNIVSGGGTDDPSTKKVTVFFRWQGGQWSSFVSYLTRQRNKVFVQSDWSGGAADVVVATGTVQFATSTNISYSTVPGSIQLAGLSSIYGIDPNYRYAWSEAIGWIDFYSTGSVQVESTELKGFAEAASVGYIALNCDSTPNGNICATSNFKVLNNGGTLSGWAWNDQIGWISFNCSNTGTCGVSNYKVVIDLNGYFTGWAWSENIGWISFNCADQGVCATSNYKVKTNWVP